MLPAALLTALLLPGCTDREPTAASSPADGLLLATAASASGVKISQVYGAGGNTGAPYRNDFVELYNAGADTVPVGGWSVQYASAAGSGFFSGNPVAVLSGSIAPGQYYLVQLAGGATGSPLPTAEASGAANMSGTAGKVALVSQAAGLTCNGGSTLCSAAQRALIVDLVGYGTTANFFEGSAPAPAPSTANAIFRRGGGSVDTDNNSADFTPAAPAPRNSAIGTPRVTGTVPASNAVDVAHVAKLRVTFSKPVTTGDGWYAISCTSSGAHAATVSGGESIYTLDPVDDFALGETCTATIRASAVADQGATPVNMAGDYSWSFTVATTNVCEAPYTKVYDIQGDGPATLMAGQTVTTRGVVVGDYEGAAPALRGYYVQDLTDDGKPETSNGVFVFNNNDDDVALGDVVSVTGRAEEYQGQTQLGGATSAVVCSSGAAVAPVEVRLPAPTAAHFERYEGMLVTLPQPLYVTEHFQLGRFGQVVLSSERRLAQPTSVALPGAPALAVQEANDRNRIIVDDGRNAENPDPIIFGRGGMPLGAENTLRGGDEAAPGIVGVMTYTWAGNSASGNAYRVHPVNALGGVMPAFSPTNARPTSPPAVGGSLKVAAANLLNYFNTFGATACSYGVGGGSAECRGADNAAEFDRQWPKTVAGITTLAADVLGVIEIENDGYGPASAIAHLVDRLNAVAGAGTYAFIDVDAGTGQTDALGTDAIKVGLIYKPAAVTPVGTTAALNSADFVNGGDAFPRNRAALAQAFEQPSGARFIVTVNHLKSKGSACTARDLGDGQGNCNVVRTNAAKLLASWLAADPTHTGDPDVLIVGDLNAYAKEDPITALTTAGYANLIERALGAEAYSYAFDGQWGYLDHALASSSLATQVAGVAEWHINADEPGILDYNTNFKSPAQVGSLYKADMYRIADHDPVVVGLNLPTPYPFGGFLAPVANAPTLNDVRAGSAIPVRFSLGGDRGLGIFQAGFPASRAIQCPEGDVPENDIAETVSAGQSGLSYDPDTDSYTYVWKTQRTWANSCRELVLRLDDGTQKTAQFHFTR